MKRGLYISFGWSYTYDPKEDYSKYSNGIMKKIHLQIQTFEKYGYKMTYYNPYFNKKFYRIGCNLPFYWLNHWDFDINAIKEYSFIYARKSLFLDGDVIRFFKKCKKFNPNIKIILEIPTYPYYGERKDFKSFSRMLKDRFWVKFLKQSVDRIVTYSNDINIFGVKTIRIVNAIDCNMITPINNCRYDKYNIHLIACSSLSRWHGYDRAIEGLHEYYQKTGQRNVYLHIVGNGPAMSDYQQKIKAYKLTKYVFLYGEMHGTELDDIYNKCDAALDSMGRHRSNVFYNSSLKGKEYCAKGLPIISGVATELDDSKDFSYYMRIPADDTSMDVEKVVAFLDRIYMNETKKKIQTNIVNYAKLHFDYPIAMNCIREYIESK